MADRIRTVDELKQQGADALLKMSELAELTGLRKSTLKHWVENGIVPYEQADTRLTRRFRKGPSIKRIDEIKHLKEDKRYTMPEILDYYKVKA